MNSATPSRLRFCLGAVCLAIPMTSLARAADRARGDSDARYLHHIDLYDIDNRKITAESTRPFSSLNTCGRCHDYNTISHGWHFNAFQSDSAAGRSGEPWIWTDPKTGTQLPLSYRGWPQTHDPRAVGISTWEMAKQFGDRLPGNLRQEDGPATQPPATVEAAAEAAPAGDAVAAAPSRWALSGALEIDCMVCHASSGVYDFNVRRQQIAEENFAWAPTAALRLGVVDGRVAKIKEDADPQDEATLQQLPKVAYDATRFQLDGSVFMDLIRQPESNACYQCHSQRTVTETGIEPRWIHDEDVHLRAGMACADCHRNGIDHHIVRGFDGEQNPSGEAVETLSCTGCHLGTDDAGEPIRGEIATRAGRLGAPLPLHAGLPPLHFEKLSCTACHSGPVPRDEAIGMLTSLAHSLGEEAHRTGAELPAIVGPVYARGDDGRIHPQRAMWPAFWGVVKSGQVEPLPPGQVYKLTRKALRVRQDMVEELLRPSLGSSELKALLGEERAKLKPEAWDAAEQAKVDAARVAQGRQEFAERVAVALTEIQQTQKVEQAAYVSSGIVYVRADEGDSLRQLELSGDAATAMVRWPLAHNVRPAGWSLGAGGCLECHSEQGKIFTSTVAAVGPGPDDGEPVTMASLQGLDPLQQLAWNESFRGRAVFKYLVGGSIAVLLMVLMIGIGAVAARLAGRHGGQTA